MTIPRLMQRFNLFLMIFLALIVLTTVPGCSGGGGGNTVVNANPAGYYINTGTASVDDGMGGTIDISDLQAMVNGNRIMMMSAANKLLYDGTITNISGNRFTADFTIYSQGGDLNGAASPTATASGIITADSSITGTLVGSGVGNGTFSLLYDTTASNSVADLARIKNVAGVNATWDVQIGGGFFPQKFIIDNAGVITHDTSSLGGGIFTSCELNGNITPITDSSLYSVNVKLKKCDITRLEGTYIGLATSRTDSATDDTLVFAAVDVNGLYSIDGDSN